MTQNSNIKSTSVSVRLPKELMSKKCSQSRTISNPVCGGPFDGILTGIAERSSSALVLSWMWMKHVHFTDTDACPPPPHTHNVFHQTPEIAGTQKSPTPPTVANSSKSVLLTERHEGDGVRNAVVVAEVDRLHVLHRLQVELVQILLILVHHVAVHELVGQVVVRWQVHFLHLQQEVNVRNTFSTSCKSASQSIWWVSFASDRR